MLQKCQKILVNNRSNCSSHVTSYGTIGPGKVFGNARFEFSAPCIQALASRAHAESKAVFIWHMPDKSVSDVIASAYLKYMIGSESPWKILTKAQPEQDIEFVFENGYVLTNLAIPSNVVGNFMTAFRQSQERPGLVTLWHELVEGGASKGAAISTCGLLQQYNSSTKTGTFCNYSWHFPLGNEYLDSETVDRLNNSEPRIDQMSPRLFCENTNYTPCNNIWGHSSNKGYNELVKFSSNFGTSKLKRMFQDPPSYESKKEGASFTALLEFAKALDDKKITL